MLGDQIQLRILENCDRPIQQNFPAPRTVAGMCSAIYLKAHIKEEEIQDNRIKSI